MMNIEIFRQYDIRGHADRDLTDETVREIGQAFGSYVLDSANMKLYRI
jgi:phosphomannomutase/phosphoglucomutase